MSVGSLYGITLILLSLSETPGCNSILRVPFTCVCMTLYGPLVLLPNVQGFRFFLKYPLLRDRTVVLTMFLIFAYEVFIH